MLNVLIYCFLRQLSLVLVQRWKHLKSENVDFQIDCLSLPRKALSTTLCLLIGVPPHLHSHLTEWPISLRGDGVRREAAYTSCAILTDVPQNNAEIVFLPRINAGVLQENPWCIFIQLPNTACPPFIIGASQVEQPILIMICRSNLVGSDVLHLSKINKQFWW